MHHARKKPKTMKIKNNIIVFGLILTMTACSKDNFDTGLKGTLKLGYGDCMPPVNTTNRTYNDFSGKVYFVSKSSVDNPVNSDILQLKENSINKKIKKGKLAVELPADTFYIMTDEINSVNSSNMFVITSGQVLQRDFNLWICTSY
jgi:hypothetical protein